MGIIIFLLTILIGAGIGIGIIYAAYFALTNYQPNKSKIRTDLRKMKEEITPWISNLVPWDKEELELMSSTQTNQTVKKGMVTTAKGIFTSIYHEPLIAYSLKKYISDNHSILFARSSNHEFVYRKKKGKTEIFIDNQKVGFLNEKGMLYGNRRNRLLARINNNDTLELPIIIGEKEVGTVMKPKAGTVNPRAFQFVNKMGKQEEAVFLSLAILELVENSIN